MVNYNSNGCLEKEDIKCLIEQVTTLLGGASHITDKEWCILLNMAVEEYMAMMENWLIKNQWTSLANQDITTTDICVALTRRSHDFVFQFTQAYSKQVGLQSKGSFELKKDFITFKPNQNVYSIPAGREINQVLWFTGSGVNNLAVSQSMGNDSGSFGKWLSDPAIDPYYIAPAYDIILRAQDIKLKRQLIGKDKPYYKVTATADGGKLLHIHNYGGSCGGCNKGGCKRCGKVNNCKIWYHYYDTNNLSDDKKKEMMEKCKDIIKFPYEVESQDFDFCDLNKSSKVWVRKYLTALAKEMLGKVYGKFKGEMSIGGKTVNLNYESFENQGIEEKNALNLELKEQIEALSNSQILEQAATDAENVLRILKTYPNGCIFSF